MSETEIVECVVCMEQKTLNVYDCNQPTHLLCAECKPKVNGCPICRFGHVERQSNIETNIVELFIEAIESAIRTHNSNNSEAQRGLDRLNHQVETQGLMTEEEEFDNLNASDTDEEDEDYNFPNVNYNFPYLNSNPPHNRYITRHYHYIIARR